MQSTGTQPFAAEAFAMAALTADEKASEIQLHINRRVKFWLLEPTVTVFYMCCFWVLVSGWLDFACRSSKPLYLFFLITKESFRNVENMRPL